MIRRGLGTITARPVIVVRDGEPIDRNLARNRITLGELLAAARQEGIGSLNRIEWAVLETSGRISFIERKGSNG